MNTEVLKRAFNKMGARVFISNERPRFFRGEDVLQLNVRQDKEGEFFSIWSIGHELEVLNIEPKDRHLLLMDRVGKEKHRYLLGHDERHWFVAGIPESTPVSTVKAAKEALKPHDVQRKEVGLGMSARHKRKNAARIRQGEWFFVPENLQIDDGFKNPILHNEPIVRSRGGKPHMCQDLYRTGGTTVYVSRGYPSGLTQRRYDDLDKKERESRNWTVMKRDMDVWVRGTIRHPDHKTITLKGWHRVLSNTEHLSFAMKNVAFLD